MKLLALAPAHRLHREQLMDLLWPDSGRKAASNSLRGALHAARKTLDPAVGSDYLASNGESLVLCPSGELWVDVDAFERAATAARRSRDQAAYRAALELYAGELLPADRYEGWAEGRREELRRLRIALLVELAGLYGEHGEFAPAMEVLQGVLAEEPSNEEAHAGLMRMYALSGSRAKALAQFGRLERTIYGELGTEPSASSRALRDEISAGLFPPDETHLVSSLPGKPAGGGTHNLPAQRTSFVGREREMVEVKRTLAMTRILTLTGSGGSGKTRLALEVARDLTGAYPDGLWLVELAPLSEGELVPIAVANAVRVHEQAARPLTETLVDALRGKDMLLLVDNCEHLVESIAHLLDVLLDGCPRLRVLATSREPLDVAGEVRWTVPTLSVPDPSRGSTVEKLEGYESVRLFVARAHDRDPSFSLTPGNAQAVTEVCRRLEGIPLAIELVAARVGTLSVEQISERLERPLELLARGGRTVAPRQRTLKKTFDWSHDLLTKAERALFRRLAVFVGGSTLEAAEAVCSGDGIEHDDFLDLLGGLVDKSLVVTEPSTGGAVRYRMLEPVRQYALKKLEESREGETLSRRHAEYFLRVAEAADLELLGPDRLKWLERLRPEHPNVRTALSWALERKEAELALRLAGTSDFSSFGEWSGLGEWRGWLEEALANGEQAPPTARAMALGALMWVALWQGDFSRAEAAGEECLALSRQTDDPKGVAFALRLLASVAIADRGDYRRATGLYEEGMALCREHGYKGDLAYFLSDIGENCMLQGDYGRAKELHDEAATLLREEMNGSGLELVLESQGWATLLQGEREQARSLFEEGLALCRNVDNKLFAIGYLEGLACIAAASAEDQRAAKLFGAARTLHKTLGYRQSADQRVLREPYLTVAQSRLDESMWEAAFAEGKAMTFEQAVEFAIAEEQDTPPTNPMLREPPDGASSEILTHREEEIAILVTRGLTNRQIAAELLISESTVESHLARIFEKLGMRSRTQLAVWMNDRAISDPNSS